MIIRIHMFGISILNSSSGSSSSRRRRRHRRSSSSSSSSMVSIMISLSGVIVTMCIGVTGS